MIRANPETDPSRHVATLEQVMAICSAALLVAPADVAALRQQFEFEEALGPLLNPTQYHRVAEKFLNSRDAADAFGVFRRALDGIAGAEVRRLDKLGVKSEP